MTIYIVTLYNDKGDWLNRTFLGREGTPNGAIEQAFPDFEQRGLTPNVIGAFVRTTYLH